jgi:hypothetical protein
MAAIVGAIGLPHNPNFPALVASTGAHGGTAQSYSRAASDLAALRADAILMFTTDHLNTLLL